MRCATSPWYDKTGRSGVERQKSGDIVALLEAARRAAAGGVNALMSASCWEIGRRIVEFEEGGAGRAGYQLICRSAPAGVST